MFANKQDIDGCMSVAQVASALGLTSIKNRTYQIFKTSAVRGDGLTEAMDWLADTLNRQSWEGNQRSPFYSYAHRLWAGIQFVWMCLLDSASSPSSKHFHTHIPVIIFVCIDHSHLYSVRYLFASNCMSALLIVIINVDSLYGVLVLQIYYAPNTFWHITVLYFVVL